MLAPLDAKAEIQVGGETITLRLNFRSVALADAHGIDVFADMDNLSSAKAATLVKCLAVQEHPDFTEDHTLAISVQYPDQLRNALVTLFTKYGGVTGGNGTGLKKARPRK